MTVIALPVPSWVTVNLDTTPPVLTLNGPASVTPPEVWVGVLRSNEDLGPCAALFEDARGHPHVVGLERLGTRALRIVLPTVGLAGGSLRVVARDTTCNVSIVNATIQILREDDFKGVLTIEHGLEVNVTMNHGYEVEGDIEHSHDVALTQDHGFEILSDIRHGHDVTLEVTDGNQ